MQQLNGVWMFAGYCLLLADEIAINHAGVTTSVG